MKRNKAKKHAKQNRFSGAVGMERLQAYLNIHAHALFSSLGRLSRTPFTTGMTIIVMAIAISLACSFFLLVSNVQQFTGNLESSNQISLFMKTAVADDKARSYAERLQQNPKIQQVTVISKQQAMEEFKANSGFGDALKALEKNPLPSVIQVLPKNSLENQSELESLLTELQQNQDVDFAQIDMLWVKRLQTILRLARRTAAIVSFLLGIAVLFITGNTIRLELHNRKEEVVIAKLVGATHAFIQRPFLYSGFWYGFIAGVSAWIIVTLMMLVLQQPVEQLSLLYDGDFNLLFLGWGGSCFLLLTSSALGVLGSWVVLSYQLHQLKPE